MDPKKLMSPGIEERLSKMLTSGVDPLKYSVSAEQLRKVILESDASRNLKRRLIAYLERNLIKNKPLVNCVHLGAVLYTFTMQEHDPGLIRITENIRDLDKLPYVIANGVRVN